MPIIVLAIVLIICYVPPILYSRYGFMKWWFHGVLNWHEPDESPDWFDGCTIHARCKHCGKKICQDSQGNWY